MAEYKASVKEVLDNALNGRETANYEFPLFTKHGTRREILLNATTRRDASGAIVGVVGVGQDITEKKAAERYQFAEQAKSRFLAAISHELRTPLNFILGMLELLLEAQLPESASKIISDIFTVSNLLLNLINDILDLSKVEAGKLELSYFPFDVHSTLSHALELVSFQIQQKQISLSLQILPGVPKLVMGDSNRFRQVLLNLLTNAIKFTPSHGKVTVISKLVEEHEDRYEIMVEVHDTGIGIKTEEFGNLFTLFGKLKDDRAKNSNAMGCGLGLAISKQLCEVMDGRIGVESTYGVGSKFWFTITVKKLGDSDVVANTSLINALNEESTSTGAKRILLVEDNDFNISVARAMLAKHQHVVDVAVNGAIAADKFQTGSYDVIFMDCEMPVMNGYVATSRIREIEKKNAVTKKTPIIGLTAFAMKGDREKCLDAGMDDYATKPVSRATLLRMIKKWCGDGKDPTPLTDSHAFIASIDITCKSGQDNLCLTDSPVEVEPQLFRFTEILARNGYDQEMALENLDSFICSCHNSVDKLREGVETGRFADVRVTAHALKGAAAFIGAEKLRVCASRLEKQANDETTTEPELFSSLEELEETSAVLIDSIKRWRAKDGAI
eukprot:GILJ01003377.1.p1 GENE.GILJ01003377.1~~GILJ01003377.1.p1  ORF type:complete len:685 (-),score=133.74 GILJ01003377.1:190-2031(-)